LAVVPASFRRTSLKPKTRPEQQWFLVQRL
jgi:hypothetical protein